MDSSEIESPPVVRKPKYLVKNVLDKKIAAQVHGSNFVFFDFLKLVTFSGNL